MPTLPLVVLTLTLTASPSDWPSFRGPGGNGHAADAKPVTEWNATKNITWKQPVPGQGWSSPVIVDGRIYLSAAVPAAENSTKEYSLRLLCLDAKRGDIQWDTEVFRQDSERTVSIHPKNSHASPTPLVENGRVYVHFGHQGTACVDADGKVLWRTDKYRYAPVHGNGGTPILVDEALIFSCDGAENPFVLALHRDTGEELWKQPRNSEATKKFSFSTPLYLEVDGRPQVISPGSNLVAGYDPKTGKELWRVTYDGYSVIPKPVYGHGLVYICTGYNTPSLLAIRPDGEGDVTETHVAWKISRGVPHTPSLLLVGDELYMVSDKGIATCVDAATGTEHWQERIGGNFSASPLFANGRIYLLSEEGEGILLAPEKTFKVLARNKLEERTLASYGVSGNTLFIRSDKHLYRIEE